MSGHHIVWTLDRDYLHGKVVCGEPVGADCRLGPQSYQDCHCERWNVLRDDDSAPYHLPDGADRAIGDRHYMTDIGECNVALFLNEDPSSLPELFAEGVTLELARTPIRPVWGVDTCEWERAETKPTRTTCPACGRDMAVTPNGRVFSHADLMNGGRCAGSRELVA